MNSFVMCCCNKFKATTSTFVGEDKTTLCVYFGMPGQIAQDFTSLWSVCWIVPISIEARLVLVSKSLQITKGHFPTLKKEHLFFVTWIPVAM
jgi:hypothetical protein